MHRDVSPQNVLVGCDGVAKLLDFGIAKAIGQTLRTAEGELLGKGAYMAPEQLEGRAVTPQTDVFAAAIVLWEVLVGRRLFVDESAAKTLENVLSMRIPAPSTLAPGISPELDAVVKAGNAASASAFLVSDEAVRITDVVLDLTGGAVLACGRVSQHTERRHGEREAAEHCREADVA